MESIYYEFECISDSYLIDIDLSLFTEEKTEPGTAKRRREAREKGQIPRSRELVTATLLIITFWAMKTFANMIFGGFITEVKSGFRFPENLDDFFTMSSLTKFYLQKSISYFKLLGPVLGCAVLVALIVNYLQVGSLFTAKPITPSFDKLNPLQGFKRLFSSQSLVELFKSIFKILLIGYFIYSYLFKNYVIIPSLMDMDIRQTASYIANMIYNIGIRAGAVLFILSIFDYGYQYWQHEKSLRMTKQEVKDEYKQTEGNPLIKGKIREKQRMMAMRRMMSEVPKADVIITNPTHFAVAIKYDPEVSESPQVLAKGKDLIAKQIREKAKEFKIPLVENPPLAQALYKTVEIGQNIPADLYKAVAEVLAYVYSLKNER